VDLGAASRNAEFVGKESNEHAHKPNCALDNTVCEVREKDSAQLLALSIHANELFQGVDVI
jgi:hypothetical protein